MGAAQMMSARPRDNRYGRHEARPRVRSRVRDGVQRRGRPRGIWNCSDLDSLLTAIACDASARPRSVRGDRGRGNLRDLHAAPRRGRSADRAHARNPCWGMALLSAGAIQITQLGKTQHLLAPLHKKISLIKRSAM